jgi:hypothetical protein
MLYYVVMDKNHSVIVIFSTGARSVVYLVEDIFGRERAGLFFDAGKDSATSPTIPVSRRHELEP